ncbi:hypothetical protein EDC01DRAFT_630151 [Geopyxis carbonaria]|nr:hypothetical protein EDC01DRAFT_630151 [Geopyxis carbonaria]
MPRRPITTIRIVNIPPFITRNELLAFLAQHGFTDISRLSLSTATSSSTVQTATVTFTSEAAARAALALGTLQLNGCRLGLDADFFGITPLAVPRDAVIDVCAVHGLNGHAFNTWVNRELDTKADKAGTMWLRDFLPAEMPLAKIMTYGYNSVLTSATTKKAEVTDFARDLLERLVEVKEGEEKQSYWGAEREAAACVGMPFTGRDCGETGWKALVLAKEEPYRYPHIFDCVVSVMFLATPHNGSKSADIGTLVADIASLAFQRPAKKLLETLKFDSPQLVQLSESFRKLESKASIVSFYELRPTPVLNTLIVDKKSAVQEIKGERIIPMDATHSGICKFQGPAHSLTIPVLSHLRKLHKTASQTKNLTRSVPFLIVPVTPNIHFFGRTEELETLRTYFETQDERRSRCMCVAVHGLGGVGKTQLVTEYLFQRHRGTNTSIFWISAESQAKTEEDAKNIAREIQVVYNDWKQEEEDAARMKLPALEIPSDVEVPGSFRRLNALLKWMAEVCRKDWLIVIDNYDNLNIKPFIPKNINAGNVIITSRDRRLVGNIAEVGVELKRMNDTEAEGLFLRSLAITSMEGDTTMKPADHPEYAELKKIVEELDGFPLALNQGAAFIRENGPMKLKEYLEMIEPRSEDRELLLRYQEVNPSYPESVMTTWEISFRLISQKNPQAASLLQLLGFFGNSHISENLFLRRSKYASFWRMSNYEGVRPPATVSMDEFRFLASRSAFRTAVGLLISLSLVSRNLVTEDLSVHPLVHEWIRVRLNEDPQKQAELSSMAASIVYQSYPLDVITTVRCDGKIYPLLEDSPKEYSREGWFVEQEKWEDWLQKRGDRLQKREDRLRQDDLLFEHNGSHHIDSVSANMLQYGNKASAVPLECFSLLVADSINIMRRAWQPTSGTGRLAGYSKIFKSQASNTDKRYTGVISYLGVVFGILANVERGTVDKSNTGSEVIYNFAPILLERALTDEVCTEIRDDDEHVDFKALLVNLVVDLYYREKLSGNRENVQSSLYTCIFKKLWFLFKDSNPEQESGFEYLIQLFINYNLMRINTAETYRTVSKSIPQLEQHIWPQFEPKLEILSKEHLLLYLDECLRIHWESPERDLEKLNSIIRLCLKKCPQRVKSEIFYEQNSSLGHISNSFGRKDPMQSSIDEEKPVGHIIRGALTYFCHKVPEIAVFLETNAPNYDVSPEPITTRLQELCEPFFTLFSYQEKRLVQAAMAEIEIHRHEWQRASDFLWAALELDEYAKPSYNVCTPSMPLLAQLHTSLPVPSKASSTAPSEKTKKQRRVSTGTKWGVRNLFGIFSSSKSEFPPPQPGPPPSITPSPPTAASSIHNQITTAATSISGKESSTDDGLLHWCSLYLQCLSRGGGASIPHLDDLRQRLEGGLRGRSELEAFLHALATEKSGVIAIPTVVKRRDEFGDELIPVVGGWDEFGDEFEGGGQNW